MRRPDGDAVRCGGEALAWSELAARSYGLARLLLEAGARPGDPVAVLLGKSPAVPVAFYGVMAAGCVLVPIDPKSPAEQVIRIIRATGARHLVTEPARQSLVPGLAAACPALEHLVGVDGEAPAGLEVLPWRAVDGARSDRPPAVALGGSATAYILHTSGSTGRPKLISHTHDSALAFVEWAAGACQLTPEDVLSNHSSHHTCFATFDYYAAARAAATTVILTPAAMMMPASLAQLIEKERMTVWYSVPTALVQLLLRGNLDQYVLDALRWVLFAGERFPEKHLAALREQLPRARFMQVYGSTEVNVCTAYRLPDDGSVPDPLPIGIPCTDTFAEVVTPELTPVAAGEAGELLIAGPTLMSGYLDDPAQNDQVLITQRGADGVERCYFRTGDRVRSLPDGNLVFAGRSDFQVKVRGHRVELEAVERALLSLATVQEAVAFTVPDGEGSARLRAVVVAGSGDGADPQASGGRALALALRQLLPAYAIPELIDVTDVLPRTATGKVDRNTLTARYGAAAKGETRSE